MRRLFGYFVPILVVGILLLSIIWPGNYYIYDFWLPKSIVFSVVGLMMVYISLFYFGFVWLFDVRSSMLRTVILLLFFLLIATVNPIVYWYFYDWLPRWDIWFYDPDKPFNETQFNRRIVNGLMLILITSLSMAFFRLYKHHQDKRDELHRKLTDMSLRFSSAHIYPHFVQSVTSSAIGQGLLGRTKQRSMDYLHAVMRYVLQVQKEPDVLVTLHDEWQYASKLLEVAQMHHDNHSIQVEMKGKIPKWLHTVPMVLITLVENSLKHSSLQVSMTIEINFVVDEEGFLFTCINTLMPVDFSMQESNVGGFGMRNLRDRIEQSGLDIQLTAGPEQGNFIARVAQQEKKRATKRTWFGKS